MKTYTLLIITFLFSLSATQAQNFSYPDSWGKAGFNLVDSRSTSVQVVFSIPSFSLEDIPVNGQTMKTIDLPGIFLFNDEGMPDLPGEGRYIAVPQGASAKMRILSQRTEIIHHVELIPAPGIPADNDDRPLQYIKNSTVYSKNEYYPSQPVQISGHKQIRGLDVIMLGITPFRYNPVTKDLIVYRDLKVQVDFEGGNGHFGDDAYRNHFWDPILQDAILNHSSLPVIDYNKRFHSYPKKAKSDECEYIIISPNGSDFVHWADSISNFRNQQGILTHVFTLTDVGGNTTTAIKNFIDNAYNNWTIKPAACLLLGDYGTDPNCNVISTIKVFANEGESFPSDHVYADVNGDDMAEIVFSRIVANNNTELTAICSRFLDYERNPPMDTGFYQHPVTALGWETDRWFQLCSEIVGGYFKNVLGKNPVRINSIYQGIPGTDWSTATNTSQIISYFGPSGTGYIPQTPAEMPCCWDGGNAAQIKAAIENGAFLVQHRDHGYPTGWGEPSYTNANIDQLTNTRLPFVMSINCETGEFDYINGDCFGERFIKHTYNGQNSGALGLVCPADVSFSFVNDTFAWGMYDNMWPDFMPTYGTTPASRGECPAFGMVAGKYFLEQSSWPYNWSNKKITYYLFHMFGDAFLRLFSEQPQALTITHDPEIPEGATTFSISANDSSDIALTVNNEIIGTGMGNGSTPVNITITAQAPGTMVLVTVTKQNYLRYQDWVPVTNGQLLAIFTANNTQICNGSGVNYTDESTGSPTSWLWTFEGGNPSSSTVKNPANIIYNTAGDFSVTLQVSNDTSTQSTTKSQYIHVYYQPTADFTVSNTVCVNDAGIFNDQSNPNGGTITDWAWDFGDGKPGSTSQNPLHTFTATGTYNVTLTVTNNGICSGAITKQVNVLTTPGISAQPAGSAEVCPGSTGNLYTTGGTNFATSYVWEVSPVISGTMDGTTDSATFAVSATYSGIASISVMGMNDCGQGSASTALTVIVKPSAAAPPQPAGADSVNIATEPVSEYVTGSLPAINTYAWFISPAGAGTISGTDTAGTVIWNDQFRGPLATITVKGIDSCGPGLSSKAKIVNVKNTLGIAETGESGIILYPNPNNGKFTINFTGNTTQINIRIVNALGSSIFAENNIKMNGKYSHEVDLSSLPSGIYFLKIETLNRSVVRLLDIRK